MTEVGMKLFFNVCHCNIRVNFHVKSRWLSNTGKNINMVMIVIIHAYAVATCHLKRYTHIYIVGILSQLFLFLS